MSCDFGELLGEDFYGNAPATGDEVATVERSLGKRLPDDFRGFLYATNGGVGSLGGNYVNFWTTEELQEFNHVYQVSEYAPGLLLFGSDGGGEGYAFDTRILPFPVVAVPFVGMSLDYVKRLAPGFSAFLKKLGG